MCCCMSCASFFDYVCIFFYSSFRFENASRAFDCIYHCEITKIWHQLFLFMIMLITAICDIDYLYISMYQINRCTPLNLISNAFSFLVFEKFPSFSRSQKALSKKKFIKCKRIVIIFINWKWNCVNYTCSRFGKLLSIYENSSFYCAPPEIGFVCICFSNVLSSSLSLERVKKIWKKNKRKLDPEREQGTIKSTKKEKKKT